MHRILTFGQELHEFTASRIDIRDQDDTAVHQQTLFRDRLYMNNAASSNRIHEEGIKVTVDGIILILQLLLGIHFELLH